MDVIAHGLWGGAPFFSQGRKKFFSGFLIGMAPYLLSFGVFHVMHPEWITLRLAGKISGPPALTILPPYVFHAYNLTHSLFVWAVAFLLPFPTTFVNGIPWSTPWFMIANYASMFIVYSIMFLYLRKRRTIQ